MVSFELTAYTAKKNLQFQVDSYQIWSGPTKTKCKVDTIILN